MPGRIPETDIVKVLTHEGDLPLLSSGWSSLTIPIIAENTEFAIWKNAQNYKPKVDRNCAGCLKTQVLKTADFAQF